MKLNIFILLSVLFCMHSCKEKTVTTATAKVETKLPTIEYTKYNSDSYSINHPSSYKLREVSKLAEMITIRQQSEERIKFATNYAVQVSDRNNATLDKMKEKFTKQILSINKGAEISESERLSRNGMEYHQIVYTSTSFGGITNINQYYAADGIGYFLSATCSNDKFELLRSEMLSVLNSFEMK